MIRSLHRWPGLVAAVLLTVMAVSGAVLSFFPAREAFMAPSGSGISIAELAGRVQQMQPTVEQIRRAPSGKITAYFYEGDTPKAVIVDPSTGGAVADADPSPVQLFLTNLHRSLFLGDAGRLIAGAGAMAMLALCISGLLLLARRMGGWKRLLRPIRRHEKGYLHAVIARFAMSGLLLSSLTGIWMTASAFGWLPDGDVPPAFPATVSGKSGAAPASIKALRDMPLDVFRSLTFPAGGDLTDIFTIKTSEGTGYIDQGNGEMLAWSSTTAWARVSDWVNRLHTGQGLSVLGLVLAMAALGVPVMAWTGVRLWIAGLGTSRFGKTLQTGTPADDARIVILVGSEGGTTWAFARTLQETLTGAGASVHTAALSSFAPDRWPAMRRLIILTATYGNGEAPASATGFLDRLAAVPEEARVPVAVLGFGDRSFPSYCAYAQDVSHALDRAGWRQFIALDTVDRQSPQDFARWGRALSAAFNKPFELNHQPVQPVAHSLRLARRRDYGREVQAPTSILRFDIPRISAWSRLSGRKRFPAFEAGDLLGIVPQGSSVPRYYSLASGTSEGFAEICVRRQAGGLCSSALTALEPGEEIRAFIRSNPGFRPSPKAKSVVLIGAGTGIGPLAGFIRGNRQGQAMHLFFGARHAESDALYAEDVAQWQDDGRLASFTPAYSRSAHPRYVQHALRDDAARVARLIADGGQILVCGGREMAACVAAALAEIIAGHGLTLAALKAEGRYAEDVY